MSSVGFSPCGTYICSASFDKVIKIWEVKTGNLVHVLKGHNDGVSSVTYD